MDGGEGVNITFQWCLGTFFPHSGQTQAPSWTASKHFRIKIHFWFLQVISLLLQENRDLIRELSCLSMGSPQRQFMNNKQKLLSSKNSTKKKKIYFTAPRKIQVLLQLVTSCTSGVLTTKYLVPTNFLYTEGAMC